MGIVPLHRTGQTPWCRRLAGLCALAAFWAGAARCVAQPPPLVTPQVARSVNAASTSAAAAPALSPSPYNLHVVATEAFLNRIIARRQVEPGDVDECILGAKVNGQRWTATDLRIDLVPSRDKAHAVVVLDGHVTTQTLGVTEQAAVRSVGQQQFHAVKDVFFDGLQLSTRHALISVRAQNQNVGVSTPLDGTLFGGVANRIAWRMADQRRPQAEEVARQRVADRIYPSFDGELDKRLADANEQLETKVRAALKRINLLPAGQRLVTTDQHLHYAATYGPSDLSFDVPPPRAEIVTPHAVNAYVHETLINGLLDRLALRGKKTTDRELRALGQRLRRAFGAQDELDQAAPPRDLSANLETEIHFDEDQPLTVSLREDELQLRIRATLKPAGQNIFPHLEIRVPFELTERRDQWVLVAGSVELLPLPKNGQPDNLTAVAADVIRQAIAASLPVVEFPRELKIPGWPEGKPLPRLTAVRSADGWVSASLD